MKAVKSIKLLSISLSLLISLLACSLVNTSVQQTPGSISPVPSMTLQSSPTQSETSAVVPSATAPTATTSPTSSPTITTATVTTTTTSTATSVSPFSQNWKAYNYTCAFAAGGTTMTMNLEWSDPSNSESGFRVYRDNVVIVTLPPNTTSYVDVVFLAAGNTVSYSVEIFNNDWQVRSSTIVYGCQ